MSHIVNKEIYNENVNKEKVQKRLDDWATQIGRAEGAHGLNGRIRWSDKAPFNSYDEADEYIDKYYNTGNYEQVAFKYLEWPQNAYHSSKLDNLTKRYNEWCTKYENLRSKIHYKDVKSQFISCPVCGSKINRNFISSNNCPVCKNEMRPKTVLDTLKRYKEIINDIASQVKVEKESLIRKALSQVKVKWLVKVEAHC